MTRLIHQKREKNLSLNSHNEFGPGLRAKLRQTQPKLLPAFTITVKSLSLGAQRLCYGIWDKTAHLSGLCGLT